MKKIALLLVPLFFILSSHAVLAKTNFLTFYNLTYAVSENESTRVSLNVDLKNNSTEFYASSYSVQTGFKDITNVSVTDSGGPVSFNTKKNDKGTFISFSFNKNVVGINNDQKFTISFDTKEVASHYGSVWEVNIPGISNQSSFASFNVSVLTPQSFGTASIIKPAVGSSKDQRALKFSKEDLGDGGVSITYGSSQIYSFDLKYHLQNKEVFPISTEIALPSDNNYQQVTIDQINPKPSDVYIDNDGNWLARFQLSGRKIVAVEVKGKARISSLPKEETLSSSQKALFLKKDRYWETDNSKLKQLAQKLKTPQNIYNYVVNHLDYDQGRVIDNQVRAGAAKVLVNPSSAVCLEFTDLFIALSRAAGIPAREVEGFANTSNTSSRPLSLLKDVLHSWPEYYDFDKKRWIMVDPTWGNTTGGIDYFNVLDFDHFAFVIKGADSTYPIPAGGYKIPGKDSRDVEVFSSQKYTTKNPTLAATTQFKKSYLAGLPIGGKIIVTNNGGVLSPNQTVNVASNTLFPSNQNLYFDKIPPFGHRVLSVNYSPRPILTNEEDTIKIKIGKEKIESNIVVSPFYKNLAFYVVFGGIVLGSTLLILLISARRSGRLSIFR